MFDYSIKNLFILGILLSLATMLFVAVCNIGWDGFSTNVSYTINLVAIGVVAFGCTVQQASYYGFTGCLPPRYTQAVMAGESKYSVGTLNVRSSSIFTRVQPGG